MRSGKYIRRGGFTLVEILLASMVGALVAAAGAGALRATVRSREKVERRLEVSRSLRLAAARMREDLANMYRAGGPGAVKFVGSSQERSGVLCSRIVFYAVSGAKARQDKAEGDVYEVEYFLEQREGRSVLFRRLWPNPSEEDRPGGVLMMVADHIIGFEVRYQDGEDWATQWPEEMGSLPELMSVTLVSGLGQDSADVAVERFFVYAARRPAGQGGGQQGAGTGGAANGGGAANSGGATNSGGGGRPR